MAKTVLEELAALKAEAQRAQTLRATAEANRAVVQRRLEEIDGQLKSMGIDPENAEQELADIEASLAVKVAALRAAVAAEAAACEAVISATRAVL